MYRFKQGEDLVVSIPVIDNNNIKIDLTPATKIRVALVIKGLVVKKYLNSTLEPTIAGYGDLSINGVNNYQIDLLIVRDDSASFPLGEIKAEILVEFPDATLTNKRAEYSYTIGEVLKGELKDEPLI